jgi:hypothetical protein
MTDEQVTRAKAYSAIDQAVLDDLVIFARNAPLEERVGASSVILHILAQRSARRRDATAGPKTVKGKPHG